MFISIKMPLSDGHYATVAHSVRNERNESPVNSFCYTSALHLPLSVNDNVTRYTI